MDKSKVLSWTTVAHVITFVLVIGMFVALPWFVFSAANGTEPVKNGGFPATGTLFVVALLVVMVLGIVLIRYSRPYSANPPGLLIAWLGVGLILFSLTLLVVLCKALVFPAS